MAEYFLNDKNLSDFRIIPARTSAHDIGITGDFDLLKRTETTYYDWRLENDAELFIDVEEIVFDVREVKFSGFSVHYLSF